jgi:hypothetical protein
MNTTLSGAERRYVNAALHCVYAGDWKSLRESLSGVPERHALDLTSKILAKLAAHAAWTGDYAWWAEAIHHLPHPGRGEAGVALGRRLDAWATPPRGQPDPRRRDLARLALRRLRAGDITGAELLAHLDAANATFAIPLSPTVVGDIAVWAAEQVREGSHDPA